MREIGGAVLQSEIIAEYLKQDFPGQAGVKCEVTSFPTREKLEAIIDKTSEPPIAVLLHELKPFDSNLHGESGPSWRISQCFGMLTYGGSDQNRPSDKEMVSLASDTNGDLINELTQNDDICRILVIHDRDIADGKRNDLSARTHLAGFSDSWRPVIDFFKRNPSARDRLIIVWHCRHPIFLDENGNENPFYKLIVSLGLETNTIAIVNHMCLRESGVELRFDQSYESSIRNILESLSDSDIKRVLQFPQTLIRFDYGVMHLTANNGQMSGLDIHGLLAGPYRFDAARHGIVTGTTPLYISTIVREAMYSCANAASFRPFLEPGLFILSNFAGWQLDFKHLGGIINELVGI